MIYVDPYAEVMLMFPADLEKQLELRGRVCYKSELKITPESSGRFIQSIILNGHESVLEHFSATVRFVCDRGVSHELVRHRIASFSQESTRYCNYGSGDVKFINPLPTWGKLNDGQKIIKQSFKNAEKDYKALIKLGYTPQIARAVLPTALKTDIIVTMNVRQWRHFFKLRASPKAHPQMQELAGAVLFYFRKKHPAVFGDVGQLNHMTRLTQLITEDGKAFLWNPTKE